MRTTIYKLLPNVLNKKDHEELYLNNEYIYLDRRFGYAIRFKLESDDSKLRCVGIFEENKIKYFIFKKENNSNLLLCRNNGILENGDKIVCSSMRFEVGDYVANTCLAGIVKVIAMEGSCLECI